MQNKSKTSPTIRPVTRALLEEFVDWTKSAPMFLSSQEGAAFGEELREVFALATKMMNLKATDGVILPCPFCGESPEIAKHFKEDIWRLTHRCRVIGPITIDWRESVASLLKDWNRRAY